MLDEVQNWQDSESMTCHESQKLGFHVILFFGGSNVKKIIMHSRINMNISLGAGRGSAGRLTLLSMNFCQERKVKLRHRASSSAGRREGRIF